MTGRYDHERQQKLGSADPQMELLCVVRGFGYGEKHLAMIPAGAFLVMCGDDGQAFALGARSPIAGICGTRVRSAHPFVQIRDYQERLYGAVPPATCQHCLRELERRRAPIDFDALFRD
jgi:hypothetical protein